TRSGWWRRSCSSSTFRRCRWRPCTSTSYADSPPRHHDRPKDRDQRNQQGCSASAIRPAASVDHRGGGAGAAGRRAAPGTSGSGAYVGPGAGRASSAGYGPIPLAPGVGPEQEGPAHLSWSPDDGKTWHRTAIDTVFLPENPRYASAKAPPGQPKPVGYPNVV